MRRRSKVRGALKPRRQKPLARGEVPEGASPRSSGEEANVARELHEARRQQMATAEILRVIRASPNDAQPVFETIVRNAVSLCGGRFANVFRFDGELVHYVASHNVGPSYADILRLKYPMRPIRLRYLEKSYSPNQLYGWRMRSPTRSTINNSP